MSWVDSCDVWEALNALERGAERHIDGKMFRLVAGSTEQDKLFCVVNRHVGMKDHFSLVEAVEFALRGELVPRVCLLNDPRDPYECEGCGKTVEPCRRGVSPRCTPCMSRLCISCNEEHSTRHESDGTYPDEQA